MKSSFLLLSFAVILLVACQSGQEKGHEGHHGHGETDKPLTLADSLYQDVMDAHDAVMPKIGKVRGAQKRVQQILDSINALPGKAQKANQDLKTTLEKLVSELNYADFAMDKWMTEFNLDSGANNPDVRVKYLTDEKMKVTKVKEAIINSLAKADTLLKK